MPVTSQTIPADAPRTTANIDEDEALIDSASEASRLRIASLTPDALRRNAATLFDIGLESWGKGLAFAEWVQVPTSTVSEWRKGKRPVPYSALIALLHHDAAAETVLRAECEIAGYPAPVKNTVLLNTSEAVALDKVRVAMGSEMWRFFGRHLAETQYRCSLELLAAAIDFALRNVR